jgi:hypothetical protein
MLAFSSFRDPGGFCFPWNGKFLRAVSSEALAEIQPFLNSAKCRELSARGMIVPIRRLGEAEQNTLTASKDFQQIACARSVGAVFEHEKIEFASYPYEWVPDMLYAAGQLTLDLAQSCLDEGYSLKDATPYNILFKGNAPVFVDLLSFERRDPSDPMWKPHAQFCRTFVLPLLAHKFWGVRPADIFCSRRDGFEPAEVYQFCSFFRKLLPPLLTQVSIPTWLSHKAATKSIYRDRLLSSPEKARFILKSQFNRLHRALKAAKPNRTRKTVWSDYMESHSYPEVVFKAKEDFVESFLKENKPGRLLDIGSNVGHFSALAARSGARVVSIDSDLGCISELWKRAHSEELDILPLVINFSRPSAAMGWRNRECASFIERAALAFDAVLMLAVLHHLLITERVPLDEIVDLAAELTTRWLVIEFVSPEDEMSKVLTRGRDDLYSDITQAVFETSCRRRFRIVRTLELANKCRSLYLLEKIS